MIASFPHLPLAAISLSALLESARSAVIMILAFAMAFGLLAFFHEFGHFLTAKMLGMSVDQFGIGFPPTYGWTLFRRSGTSYTLHPVPLGAFVRIQGMDPGDPDTPNSFMRQPPWARLIVLVAGSAGNMVLAILVFLLLAVTAGLSVRTYATDTVEEVVPKSVAAAAGLKAGDRVIAIRRVDEPGRWIRPKVLAHSTDASDLVDFIHHSYTWQMVKGKREAVGRPLLAEISHKDGHTQVIRAVPAVHNENGEYRAALGFMPVTAEERKRSDCIHAVALSFDKAWSSSFLLVDALVESVGQLIRREITPSEFGHLFSGPVGIAQASGHVAQQGPAPFLSLLGILSINLAVLNLMPLPVFDGGNIILVLLEVIRRKQLEPAQLMAVQLVGVVFIISLFAYLTINDIINVAHHRTLMP